jgi:hypothetical protein
MKDRSTQRRKLVALLVLGAGLLAGITMWGCSKKAPTAPSQSSSSGTYMSMPQVDLNALRAVVAVQDRHTRALMGVPGVVAVGTGLDESGRAVIKVFSEAQLAPGRLPIDLEGVRVVEFVTGKIVAMRGHGGVSHTAQQTPPIQLGTSGGNVNDIANGFCCSGTLGSLVSKGGTQYILSNSHVFAGDVVSGGNGRVAQIGDDVDQPGLVDINCNPANSQIVADVSSLSTTYPPNSTPNVDCSIAQVRSGMVRTDGSILEIGTLSASTVGASVGQAVKKSGRTTGLTRSTINSINVTVSVGYDTECGGTSYTKSYTGQIFVNNTGSKFLNSGDSGSLLVEDVSTNPRAVGLLFAGSSSIAVANPIGDVLSHLGATMVGQ